MASYVLLQDITTSPKSKKVETYQVVGDDDILDEIEYCMGLQRGGIEDYRDKDLLSAELHPDMVKLLKDDQWALVPPRDALQSMLDLFEGNHKNGPSERTHFTVAIPPRTPFEYKFMGLKQPKAKLFYANGKKYEFPYDDFPIVRSNLHPCFLLPTLVRCMNVGLIAGLKHLTPLGANGPLASSAFSTLNRFFHVSWLGDTVATDFPNRRIPTVRTKPVTGAVLTESDQEDADYEVEPTPPPEDMTPEAASDDEAIQSLLQREKSAQPPSPVVERSPEIPSTSPTETLEPEPDVPQRKRKVPQASYPATDDDSTTRPAKRRSPRFTSS